MATDPIPADLIDLQRRFNAAHDAVVTAAAAGEPITALMDTERDLAVQLHRRREGTPWAAWDQQMRVRAAAEGDGGE